MKTPLFGCSLACVLTASIALGASDRPIQLHGIIGLSTNQYALLAGTFAPIRQNHMMLAKGEQLDDVEVLGIDASRGEVELRNGSEALKISFPAHGPSGTLVTRSNSAAGGSEEVPFLRLGEMGLVEFLDLYQVLAKRTLLWPTSLPVKVLGGLYSTEAVTAQDVVRAMERVLLQSGIVMLPDGEKFLVAVGSENQIEETRSKLRRARDLTAMVARTRKWSSNSTKTPSPDAPASVRNDPRTGEELIPEGTIYFPDTPAIAVLPVFEELTARVAIKSESQRSGTISLRTYSPLNKEEATYAMAAAFALNGVSMETAGEKLLLVFGPGDQQIVEDLLKQKRPVDYAAMTNIVPIETFTLAVSSVEAFAEVYGKLAGRSVEIGDSVAGTRLSFRPNKPLTAGEALQALDLLFGLNGLEAVRAPGGAGLRIVKRTN